MFKKTVIGLFAALALVLGAAAAAQSLQPAKTVGTKASAVAPAKTVVSATAPREKNRDEGENHPCHYPGQVYTQTTLRIQRDVQERGKNNYAFVTVTSNSGKPKGAVRVYLVPTDGQGREYVRYGKLHGGHARVELPEWPAAGGYDAYAIYFPNKCGKWKTSTSETEHYTVIKRKHHHSQAPQAPRARPQLASRRTSGRAFTRTA